MFEGWAGGKENHQEAENDVQKTDAVDENTFRWQFAVFLVESRILVETDETCCNHQYEASKAEENMNRQVHRLRLVLDPRWEVAKKSENELTNKNDDRCHSNPRVERIHVCSSVVVMRDELDCKTKSN